MPAGAGAMPGYERCSKVCNMKICIKFAKNLQKFALFFIVFNFLTWNAKVSELIFERRIRIAYKFMKEIKFLTQGPQDLWSSRQSKFAENLQKISKNLQFYEVLIKKCKFLRIFCKFFANFSYLAFPLDHKSCDPWVKNFISYITSYAILIRL